ncbi:MAG TPA: cytochrome P450, partial [Allosphingosinicella sp.]|nr:cytochrome P450 [Allosphingosinicella sp.]
MAPESFVPPSFPPPTGRPGLRAIWRSVRNPVLGWPPEVYQGGCYRSPVPGAPLIIGDPQLAHEVLIARSDEFDHGPLINRIFAPIWGRGIFTAQGPEWRWQRRAAAPAFRPARMSALAPIMRAAADATLQRWREGQAIDLQDETRRLTLQVLFDAALSGGEDFPDREQATRQIDAFIGGVGKILRSDVMPLPERWRPSVEKRGGAPAAFMRERVGAMVARRRREERPRGDLVDLLMAARDPETDRQMDDELVRDNLMGFISAGHETTAYALAWALWIVASHPPTRQCLLQEVEQVTGGAPIGEEHVEQLRFTAQVVKETSRLFPTVGVARAAERDTSIAGFSVRRNAPVLIAIYALHRLPSHWDRPHLFDPDRFGDGAAPRGVGVLYLPFGAGPRVCMGAAFASTELVVALATLVRGAELTRSA